MDVFKASAKLTLLSGSDKQEIELKPAGDLLEAVGSFKLGAGTKVVAQVTNAGRQRVRQPCWLPPASWHVRWP